MKSFCLLFLYFAICCAIGPKTTQENTELFKYSPTDEYTLPEDIDDDKPPVNFQGDVKHAQIVNLENKNHGQGKFKYSLQTQNGIEITQVGKLKDENTFVVSGSYSYTGADGKRYRVRYTADEFGYHPITELDVEFPELEKNNNENLGFQFLKQNIDFDSRPQNNGPYGGDAQIGDDYSYNGQKGYNYEPPENQYLPPTKEKRPSNFYLPVP